MSCNLYKILHDLVIPASPTSSPKILPSPAVIQQHRPYFLSATTFGLQFTVSHELHVSDRCFQILLHLVFKPQSFFLKHRN